MIIVMQDREIGTIGWQSDWLNEVQMWRPAALPPVVDKEREAFEAWAALHSHNLEVGNEKDRYTHPRTDTAWAAWQAARKQPAA